MDMSTPDVVRDELIKSNSAFRDLVHQHQNYENRLNELAHLTYPNDDEQIEDVLENMGELQVRRLPVVNRDKRLVGIISLGDLATKDRSAKTADALCGISKPGGEHSQTQH